VNFFQGTGSMTADGTIRTQYNQAYAIKSGLLPPYNTAYNGVAFGGTIDDTSYSYTWNPCSSGPLGLASRGNGGGAPGIAPLNQYQVRHFYNQSATSDLIVRAIAFASDFEGVGSFRDVTTGNYVNFGTGTYTGMPAPSSTVQNNVSYLGGVMSGFTAPTNGNYFNIGQQNLAHKYSMAYYAALVFGEPHFMDLCLEAANGGIIEFHPFFRNPPNGGNYSGAVPAGVGVVTAGAAQTGIRSMAWANRDLQHAATIAPPNHPDGSQYCNYIRAMADLSAGYPLLVMNSTQLGSYLAGLGYWHPVATPGTRLEVNSGGFQYNYFIAVMCMAAARENADAMTWLNTVSAWDSHVVNTFGGYHLYVEYDHSLILSGGSAYGTPITSDTNYGVRTTGMISRVTWTTGATAFTMTVDTVNGYALTTGDKFIFDPDETLPGGFSGNTPYYARDVSGTTCNLAATPGGTKITPTDSGTFQSGSGPQEDLSGPWIICAAPPAASTGFSPAPQTHI
jgi:hypothetical protein